MTDWVHCNKCYRQPGSNRKFHLTNCGHIYCEECVVQVKETKCIMCGIKCTTILLAAQMKPEVEIFFRDPVELWTKQFKQMQKITQVMEFQKNHRSRLVAHNRDLYCKQNAVVVKVQKTVGQVRDLEREVMVLKEENCYLKKLLAGKSNGGRTPPMPRSGVGTGMSQCSPQGSAQMNMTQQSYHHNQQGGNSITTKSSSRISVRTPPNRFGLLKTPSPQMNSACGNMMEVSYPPNMDQKLSQSAGQSPLEASPTMSKCWPPLPPTCMPITPNCPITPNYTMSSPNPSVSSYSQRNNEVQKRIIQLNQSLGLSQKT